MSKGTSASVARDHSPSLHPDGLLCYQLDCGLGSGLQRKVSLLEPGTLPCILSRLLRGTPDNLPVGALYTTRDVFGYLTSPCKHLLILLLVCRVFILGGDFCFHRTFRGDCADRVYSTDATAGAHHSRGCSTQHLLSCGLTLPSTEARLRSLMDGNGQQDDPNSRRCQTPARITPRICRRATTLWTRRASVRFVFWQPRPGRDRFLSLSLSLALESEQGAKGTMLQQVGKDLHT